VKLESFQVYNYKNIDDSNKIYVDPNVTCFVGKNEAGKTALLQALYRLNPIENAKYDEVRDYPRKRLREYQRNVEAKREKSAKVITATFILDDDDVSTVIDKFGDCITLGTILTIKMLYNGTKTIDLPVDEQKWIKYYTSNSGLTGIAAQKAKPTKSLDALVTALGECEDDQEAKKCLAHLQQIKEKSLVIEIWNTSLKARVPKIFFFDDYRIMRGKAFLQDIAGSADEGLKTLNDLLDLAGVTPDELQNNDNYEHHKANLEAIANEITDDVFHYWKQNTFLEVEFDVNRVRGNNQPGEFHVRIKNNKHRVTVPFDERSRGFVWFFSFLTTFKKLSADNPRMIILLDEPGLNLHASAQADLLCFIEDILAPKHQVLYTTHSPFMVDAQRLQRVRTVEDIDQQGVKVSSECLSVDANTVFPLQAALGYSLAQTLFLGPNCLIVEGPSDLLYLQAMSSILNNQGKEALSDKWVITPVGGADKLATFVTLIGANDLNVAVLMDVSNKDTQRVENLVRNNFLNWKRIIQLNEFVDAKEADIEDLFLVDEYIALVKAAYPAVSAILTQDILEKSPRIVKRIEKFFSRDMPSIKFSHYAPSKAGLSELGKKVKISSKTVDRFENLFKRINAQLTS
jgi:predicted ATPase